MQYGSVEDFLNALENRIEELEMEQDIAASTSITGTSITSGDFTEDEYHLFDSIIESAYHYHEDEAQIIDDICIQLGNLGYTDDQITQILDIYEL